VSNTYAARKIRKLEQDDYANSEIKNALQDAERYLDANKVPDASKRLAFAMDTTDS